MRLVRRAERCSRQRRARERVCIRIPLKVNMHRRFPLRHLVTQIWIVFTPQRRLCLPLPYARHVADADALAPVRFPAAPSYA